MTAQEFFACAYANSPNPVLILQKSFQIIYEGGPLYELRTRARILCNETFLTEPIKEAVLNCIETQQGTGMTEPLGAIMVRCMLTPYPFEGEIYVAMTMIEQMELPFDKPHFDLVMHSTRGIMNNSLDRINTYADLMGRKSAYNMRVKQEVLRIYRMVTHLNILMGQPDDKNHFMVPVNACAFVSNCVKAALQVVPKAPLVVKVPDEKIFVRMDPVHMERVWAILASNALRFCRRRVEMRVERFENKIAIAVIDDGPGVEFPSRLGEWGYVGADHRGTVGLGCSLPVAYGLIERDEGELHYERTDLWTGFRMVFNEEPDPRLGKLSDWAPEDQRNHFSTMWVELSDCYNLYNEE